MKLLIQVSDSPLFAPVQFSLDSLDIIGLRILGIYEFLRHPKKYNIVRLEQLQTPLRLAASRLRRRDGIDREVKHLINTLYDLSRSMPNAHLKVEPMYFRPPVYGRLDGTKMNYSNIPRCSNENA